MDIRNFLASSSLGLLLIGCVSGPKTSNSSEFTDPAPFMESVEEALKKIASYNNSREECRRAITIITALKVAPKFNLTEKQIKKRNALEVRVNKACLNDPEPGEQSQEGGKGHGIHISSTGRWETFAL